MARSAHVHHNESLFTTNRSDPARTTPPPSVDDLLALAGYTSHVVELITNYPPNKVNGLSYPVYYERVVAPYVTKTPPSMSAASATATTLAKEEGSNPLTLKEEEALQDLFYIIIARRDYAHRVKQTRKSIQEAHPPGPIYARVNNKIIGGVGRGFGWAIDFLLRTDDSDKNSLSKNEAMLQSVLDTSIIEPVGDHNSDDLPSVVTIHSKQSENVPQTRTRRVKISGSDEIGRISNLVSTYLREMAHHLEEAPNVRELVYPGGLLPVGYIKLDQSGMLYGGKKVYPANSSFRVRRFRAKLTKDSPDEEATVAGGDQQQQQPFNQDDFVAVMSDYDEEYSDNDGIGDDDEDTPNGHKRTRARYSTSWLLKEEEIDSDDDDEESGKQASSRPHKSITSSLSDVMGNFLLRGGDGDDGLDEVGGGADDEESAFGTKKAITGKKQKPAVKEACLVEAERDITRRGNNAGQGSTTSSFVGAHAIPPNPFKSGMKAIKRHLAKYREWYGTRLLDEAHSDKYITAENDSPAGPDGSHPGDERELARIVFGPMNDIQYFVSRELAVVEKASIDNPVTRSMVSDETLKQNDLSERTFNVKPMTAKTCYIDQNMKAWVEIAKSSVGINRKSSCISVARTEFWHTSENRRDYPFAWYYNEVSGLLYCPRTTFQRILSILHEFRIYNLQIKINECIDLYGSESDKDASKEKERRDLYSFLALLEETKSCSVKRRSKLLKFVSNDVTRLEDAKLGIHRVITSFIGSKEEVEPGKQPIGNKVKVTDTVFMKPEIIAMAEKVHGGVLSGLDQLIYSLALRFYAKTNPKARVPGDVGFKFTESDTLVKQDNDYVVIDLGLKSSVSGGGDGTLPTALDYPEIGNLPDVEAMYLFRSFPKLSLKLLKYFAMPYLDIDLDVAPTKKRSSDFMGELDDGPAIFTMQPISKANGSNHHIQSTSSKRVNGSSVTTVKVESKADKYRKLVEKMVVCTCYEATDTPFMMCLGLDTDLDSIDEPSEDPDYCPRTSEWTVGHKKFVDLPVNLATNGPRIA